MSSPTDICNRALDACGARTIIGDLSEASQEAQVCARHYDTVRKNLLRGAHWGFAKRQKALTLLGQLSAGTSDYPWEFKYAYPADAVLIRYVVPTPPSGSVPFLPNRANRFEIGADDTQRLVFSNVSQALAVYTGDVQNVELFDPLFEEALVYAIAAKIVTPLTGNAGMLQGLVSLAKNALTEAQASSANEAVSVSDHTPDWLAVRQGSPALAGPEIGIWFQSYQDYAWGV